NASCIRSYLQKRHKILLLQQRLLSPLLQQNECPAGQCPVIRWNLYPNVGQFQYASLEVHREIPKDHFIWSLLCFVYYNPCCLGLAALIHSVKARDRKMLGDIEGAHNYASTARTLNIISTVLFCLGLIIAIIVAAVLSGQISRMIHY
uniref:Uncharacterized protein n=1 Tax=Neogobius melanostomus TaxID=47308 RepID=A0A8C6SF01_9GOBI